MSHAGDLGPPLHERFHRVGADAVEDTGKVGGSRFVARKSGIDRTVRVGTGDGRTRGEQNERHGGEPARRLLHSTSVSLTTHCSVACSAAAIAGGKGSMPSTAPICCPSLLRTKARNSRASGSSGWPGARLT